jgi:hypothetical protein
MKNIAVGVSRSTQVGTVDHTTVGEMHVVMVSPAAEGFDVAGLTRTVLTENKVEVGTKGGATVTLDDKKITLHAPKSATITMEETKIEIDLNGKAKVTLSDNKIVLCTGASGAQATVTLEGAKISAEADEIKLHAKKGDLVIQGGPKVKINPP